MSIKIKSPVFVLFCKYILKNVEKKFTVEGFREGRSGYNKHTCLFSLRRLAF